MEGKETKTLSEKHKTRAGVIVQQVRHFLHILDPDLIYSDIYCPSNLL